MDSISVKTCSKCGQAKPATSEYFYSHQKTRDKLRPLCKACHYKVTKPKRLVTKDRTNARRRERRAARRQPDDRPPVPEGYKRCSKCGETKLPADFLRHKQSQDGRRKFCRDCQRADERAYRAATADRRSESRRAYYSANKEKELSRAHAYQAANKEAMRAIHARRRRRKLEASGSHSAEDIRHQYKAQKGQCYYCGIDVGDKYHVDHVIPLSRGGSDGPENIVIACGPCNLSKGDRMPHEWIKGGRLL